MPEGAPFCIGVVCAVTGPGAVGAPGPVRDATASAHPSSDSRLGYTEIARCRQNGATVVVLVDEYDVPLLPVLDRPELLRSFRQVMRELYAPLKSCDALLRMVLLTGITKFSQMSIFLELNNLRNVSMLPAYAGVCGVTADELNRELGDDVALLAQRLGQTVGETYDALKRRCDGYHFCEPSPDLYNPFSLMAAFANGAIDDYWYETGTPTSLIRLIKAYHWKVEDFSDCEAEESEFNVPIEEMDSPIAMLYQAGYLTIKGYDATYQTYHLAIPNQEVSRNLLAGLRRHTV